MKQLFFNFLLQTIGDYNRFMLKPPVGPEDPEYRQLASSDFFDFAGYISWQEQRSADNRDNNIDFIKHVVTTQAFCTFIERCCTRLESEVLETTPEQFFELNLEIL